MIEIIRNICCILCLAQVSYADIKYRRIPDRYVCGIILIWAAAAWEVTEPPAAFRAVASALLSAAVVLIPAVITEMILKKKTLGGGDIKLIFALGLYLGFFKAMAMILVACALMLIYMIATHTRKAGLKNINEKVPFGPSIAVSGAAGLLGW